MSLAQTNSVALLGLDGHVVNVEIDIADVAGQPQARLASEIAATAGHHNSLIVSPGTGDSIHREIPKGP